MLSAAATPNAVVPDPTTAGRRRKAHLLQARCGAVQLASQYQVLAAARAWKQSLERLGRHITVQQRWERQERAAYSLPNDG